jgi:hypothetical protein
VKPTFLVECFWPGVTSDAVESANHRARDGAAALRVGGGSVRFLGSWFIPGDEIVFFHYTASSEQEVVRALRDANLPGDRVTASLWLESDQ